MKLVELLTSWFDLTDKLPAIVIEDLTLDSRTVQQGFLFIALNQGVEFISQAIEQGAVAVLIDGVTNCDVNHKVPIISIPNLQQCYGRIASYFYGEPSKQLTVIGITGTNGKTSTSYYIAQLLQKSVGRCGIIGTLGIGELNNLHSTGLTTPDAITVHKTLKKFADDGVKYVAMEVSSHALDQGRVNGVIFHTAIFTNLSHDHLDYHGTMAKYGAAKKKLFTKFAPKHSIINTDDIFGQELLASLENTLSYGMQDGAKVQAKNILFSPQGMHAELLSPWGVGKLDLPLLGNFNLSNMLASIAAVACQGVVLPKILELAGLMQAVTGRMQCFSVAEKPLVIVDYAHTPDALMKALQAVKQHCQGDIWCVFGCGGNRDRGKRAEMAKAAEDYAKHIIVTSDNPRHEEPDAIITDIIAGFNYIKPNIEPDRAKAIAYAIKHANAHDVILIAGKGHEDYQIIGDKKYHFSDIEQVQHIFSLSAKI